MLKIAQINHVIFVENLILIWKYGFKTKKKEKKKTEQNCVKNIGNIILITQKINLDFVHFNSSEKVHFLNLSAMTNLCGA